jgi:MFS family permease
MALSNAIVPVLPSLSDELSFQTLIFSAYFFGAMISTLPAGIASDRYGQPLLIKLSLLLTLISGILIVTLTDPLDLLLWRCIEGIGAGIFISAALSWIGYYQDSLKNTGRFMASLNLGLLSGLIGSGWLAQYTSEVLMGVFTCTVLAGLVCIIACFVHFPRLGADQRLDLHHLLHETVLQISRQYPLWISVIILLGCTGYVQAIFPELSGYPVQTISTVLAAMNFATIITSLLTPYVKIESVLLIRISALMTIPCSSPFSLPGDRAYHGSGVRTYHGLPDRLFSHCRTTSGGSNGAVFNLQLCWHDPAAALGGYIISISSFTAASAIIALAVLGTALLIGKCSCKGYHI